MSSLPIHMFDVGTCLHKPPLNRITKFTMTTLMVRQRAIRRIAQDAQSVSFEIIVKQRTAILKEAI